MSTLTPPGWPRPIVNGWPIPWVSPSDELSRMDPRRMVLVLKEKRCQVCGIEHPPGSKAYLIVNKLQRGPKPKEDEVEVAVAMDNALMHERCMRLAIGRCPRLRALRAQEHLVLLSCNVDHVVTYPFDEDLHPWFGVESEHVKLEDLP